MKTNRRDAPEFLFPMLPAGGFVALADNSIGSNQGTGGRFLLTQERRDIRNRAPIPATCSARNYLLL
jgi:hypothetical protein